MPQLLNLCYVADATSIHAQRWMTFFAAQGHQVTCLTDKRSPDLEKHLPGITLIDLPGRDSQEAGHKPTRKTAVLRARVKVIRKTLKNIKPDVLHAIFLHKRGWAAALSNYHPLIITLLGSDIYLPRQNYRNRAQMRRDKWLNRLALHQADLITGVSADLCQVAQNKAGPHANIELIPIGTQTELFHADIETDHFKKQMNIPDDAFVVLSPRQMTPLYNQETILQAIPKVLQEIPKAVFILKDTFCNTDERRAYVKNLYALAEKLGVSNAIRWAAEVPMDQLPLFFNAADVVVSVPSTDGMPVTIFEAMACRKPVIVGDLPSYNEVIIHGQTGLRVPVRNHQALAQAIIKVAKNTDLVGRMIEESQLILQQYGLFDQQMRRMERYYHALKNKRMLTQPQFQRLMNLALFNMAVRLS